VAGTLIVIARRSIIHLALCLEVARRGRERLEIDSQNL
jgi:hypothetical protein